jgi:hypothetical protein
MVEVLVVIALIAVLALLVVGWFHYASEGGFLNFWIAFNLMDCAGHVLTALIAVIGGMFNSD